MASRHIRDINPNITLYHDVMDMNLSRLREMVMDRGKEPIPINETHFPCLPCEVMEDDRQDVS